MKALLLLAALTSGPLPEISTDCITEEQVLLLIEDTLSTTGLPGTASVVKEGNETTIRTIAFGVPTMLVIHLTNGCVDRRTEVPLY
jgi:hypothetical protein